MPPQLTWVGQAIPIMLVLGACSAGAPEDSAHLPYTYEPPAEDPRTAPTAAVLEDRLGEAITRLADLDLTAGFDAYEEAMAQGDAYCPYQATYGEYAYWYDDCRADNDTRFDGYVILLTWDDYQLEGVHYDGLYLYGYADITTPEGGGLAFTGDLTRYSYRYDDGSYEGWSTALNGSLHSTLPGASETWVGRDDLGEPWVSIGITAAGERYGQAGGILMLPHADTPYLSISTFWWADAAAYTECPTEPIVVAAFALGGGDWVDVTLDGGFDEAGGPDAARCDGCGVASWHGQELGPVCVDISQLPTVEDRPW